VTVAFIGLGANLGDPRRQLEQALHNLGALPGTHLRARSSLYRSAPLGYPDQPEFLNAVAQLETHLPPTTLLAELQAIEARHGRSRSFANAPRMLDLDLLLFGDERIAAPGLTVPHPRMHERAFVLMPLVEIAPEATVPGHGKAGALLERCASQAVQRLGASHG
jgi:2-amino-4-hydroxy-6-hydroxymethyldihydropteridine diphosphokinase